jgi:hypothetical protein
LRHKFRTGEARKEDRESVEFERAMSFRVSGLSWFETLASFAPVEYDFDFSKRVRKDMAKVDD